MTASDDKYNVPQVLDVLLETLEAEKERLNEEIAEATKDGEYDTATTLIRYAKNLVGFQAESENLVGKWAKIDRSDEKTKPNRNNFSHEGVIHSARPPVVPQLPRNNHRSISNSSDHCFHILDVIEKMGGVANNQDVSAAVNKRIKMLYPKFKEAKAALVQKGWTKAARSRKALEITEKGTMWLNDQKAQLTHNRRSEEDVQTSEKNDGITPPLEISPKIVAKINAKPAFEDDDFEQI